MKRRTRAFAWFLALALLVTLLPVPQSDAVGTAVYNGAAYGTDYTTWRQGDPAWGPTALGDVHTLAGSGCLISSIAILMCHSGAYDPSQLNPGSFRDWLDAKGMISHSSTRSKDGLLSFGMITPSVSPRFYFVNQVFFDVATPIFDICTKIDDLQASGYQVVARVKNSGHFVAVARTVDGDAQILDPGVASKTLLSAYNGTIGGLIYFKANLGGKDGVLSSQLATPSTPVMGKLAAAYGSGDRITVSWQAANLATHYNIHIDAKQGGGTWKEYYKVYTYKTSPFAIDPLPAGQYRLRVQAANANNVKWTYANSDYQSFTVQANSLTVTYNANGGTVSPATQLVAANATYDLPTPTKSGGAFLGWYTAAGTMVNQTSPVGTQGHTLTAKWAASGVGFSKKTTYNNNFKDVKGGSWYYGSVAAVYAYGLMNGNEFGNFAPNDPITAAQAVTLAARMRKLYLTGNGTFPSTNPWYKGYVDYAISHKIISAAPKDMDLALTRQEFAAILAGALPDEALPAINTVIAGAIADVYRSDTAVYKLYRSGIFAGSDAKGTFLPNNPITRAEVAAVLVRMADPNVRMLFTIQ